MFRTVKILFNLEHGWSVEHKSCNEMMLKLTDVTEKKSACLITFVSLNVIVSSLIRELYLHFCSQVVQSTRITLWSKTV